MKSLEESHMKWQEELFMVMKQQHSSYMNLNLLKPIGYVMHLQV